MNTQKSRKKGIIAILILVLLGIGYLIYDYYRSKYQAIEEAQMKRSVFKCPFVGDDIFFTNKKGVYFEGEVFDLQGPEILFLVNYTDMKDDELLRKAKNGDIPMNSDSLQKMINRRKKIEASPEFKPDKDRGFSGKRSIYEKLKLLESKKFRLSCKVFRISMKEYKSFGESIGDEYQTHSKPVPVMGLYPVTQSMVYVTPIMEVTGIRRCYDD